MVDSIVFGNPTQNQLRWLEKEGIGYKFFDQLSKFNFPKNSSRATREELNELVDFVAETLKDEEAIKRYRQYDYNLIGVYSRHIKDMQLTEEDKISILMNDILLDVNHLVYNLKYFFQRPRPYQLAKFYNLSLFPLKSINADSPSYPSLQIVQADILSYVLGNWFPAHYDFFDRLSLDVQDSRVKSGLNYASDLDFSMFVSELIKTDKEFLAKYSL